MVVAAFEGWNDAGDAATTAVRALVEQWQADPFADIDPEEFFDFTANRPQVRLVDGRTRAVDWPSNQFWSATVPGTETDVVLLQGTEPGLRWRTFCEQVLAVVRQLDARLVVTLGALLAEVPHTRPVRVIGTAEDDDLIDRLRLHRSTYEGPTGIVGVLHEQLPAPRRAVAVALGGRAHLRLGPDVAHRRPRPRAPGRRAAVRPRRDRPSSRRSRRSTSAASTRSSPTTPTSSRSSSASRRPTTRRTPTSADPAELIAEVERFLREQ